MFNVSDQPTVVETYTGEDGREYLRPVRWEAGLVEMVPSFGHPADESECWPTLEDLDDWGLDPFADDLDDE